MTKRDREIIFLQQNISLFLLCLILTIVFIYPMVKGKPVFLVNKTRQSEKEKHHQYT